MSIEEKEAQTQEDEVRRGRRAEALMRDSVIVEAFETLDRAFYQAYRDTSPVDHQGLVHLRLLTKCLDEFRGFFEEVLQTGQFTHLNLREALKEEAQLERLERQRLAR